MARDPRYRPFRAALWTIYLVVAIGSSALAIRSIVKNLRGPERPAAAGTLPTRAALRVCVVELEALHREQNERAWRLGSDAGEADAVTRWQTWSHEWEQRVRDLAERCMLDSPDPDPRERGPRQDLARARDAVLAVHEGYGAQVGRFAREGAALARAAAAALGEARASLARPPAQR